MGSNFNSTAGGAAAVQFQTSLLSFPCSRQSSEPPAASAYALRTAVALACSLDLLPGKPFLAKFPEPDRGGKSDALCRLLGRFEFP